MKAFNYLLPHYLFAFAVGVVFGIIGYFLHVPSIITLIVSWLCGFGIVLRGVKSYRRHHTAITQIQKAINEANMIYIRERL